MRKYHVQRVLLGVLVALLGILPTFSHAKQAVKDPIYVEPELIEDVPYDAKKPENLTGRNLYAHSAILIDQTTGEVLFEKNADEIIYPASTTKIITTFLGVLLGDLTQTVYLSEKAADIPADSSKIGLEIGESITMLDLLYATMLCSGNEGANMIAESISGNLDSFVQLMNIATRKMGCTSTNFVNAHGYHDDNHYSSVRDMAIMAQHAMSNQVFRDIAGCVRYTLPRSNMSNARILDGTTAPFLNPDIPGNPHYYPYATGIKTGYHSRAGYCFVGAGEKDGISLISVVFYTSQDGRWSDTTKLLSYGFSKLENGQN